MEAGWPALVVPICLDCLLAHPTEKLDSRQAGAGGMALEVPTAPEVCTQSLWKTERCCLCRKAVGRFCVMVTQTIPSSVITLAAVLAQGRQPAVHGLYFQIPLAFF